MRCRLQHDVSFNWSRVAVMLKPHSQIPCFVHEGLEVGTESPFGEALSKDVSPAFKVSCFGWCGHTAHPLRILMLFTQRYEGVSALDAYSLEVLGFGGVVHSFERLPETTPCRGYVLFLIFGNLGSATLRHEDAEAKVEDQSLLGFGKVCLEIEIGWISDDPPSRGLGMDIVGVMHSTHNPLRSDLLDQTSLIVAR